MKYDAFISYSHAADGHFVAVLRNELQRFATPWGPFRWTNPVRSLRIFQDKASLSANPALWPTIEQVLIESDWFILLASPESARSQWVEKEVDLWCRVKPMNRLLIVQTAGGIVWDHVASDFGSLETDALPPRLRGMFPKEPRWVDARFTHTNVPVIGTDPRLRDLVAELAAPLRGVPKDDLIGEDIRQHRRLNLWRSGALIVLTTLLVAALVAAGIALQQRNLAEQRRIETERQLHMSEYRRLAAQATSQKAFDLALLLAVEATRLDDNRETRRTLLDLLQRQRFVRSFFFDRPQGGAPSSIRIADVSPDGRLLATGSSEGLTLWDTSTHRLIAQLQEGPVSGLSFVSSRKQLAALIRDTVLLWDVNNGRLATPSSHIGIADPYVASFSSDGSEVAAVEFNTRTIRVFNIVDNTHASITLDRRSKRVAALSFAPGNRLLASGSSDGTVTLWDVVNNKMLGAPLAGHTSGVWSLAFPRDGKTLASGDDNGEIILWDMSTRMRRGPSLIGPADATYALAFNRDGSMLASGSADHSIMLWDVKTRTRIGDPFVAHLNAVWALAFGGDSESMVSTGDDGHIVMWNVHRPRIAGMVLSGSSTGVRSLAFSPNGELLATAGDDTRVTLWNARSGTQVGDALLGNTARIRALGFDSTGSIIASGSDGGTIVRGRWTHMNE